MSTTTSVGSGAYRYEVDKQWGRRSGGLAEFGLVSGVAGDAQDRVYLFIRKPVAEMLNPLVKSQGYPPLLFDACLEPMALVRVKSRADTSAGSESTIRPSSMQATRSAKPSARSRSCSTRMAVVPLPAASASEA